MLNATRIVKQLLFVLSLVLIGATFVLWLGSITSLDHNFEHTRASTRLPYFDAGIAASRQPTLTQISARDMTFRVRVAGFPGSAGNVVLLHGFPETSIMFDDMITALAAAGFAVVAFDQRGYSPGARPHAKSAYVIGELVSDLQAVTTAVGFEHYHLVGHDWGAAVGWQLLMQDDAHVDSWTALSIPHLTAYRKALATDPDQQRRSRYVSLFRQPLAPELLLTFNNLQLLREILYADAPPAALREYLSVFREAGALRAALNWYRASAEQADAALAPQIRTPTLFIWGRDDPVVGAAARAAAQPYFIGRYRELELDSGHWLLQTRGDTVIAAVLQHLQQTQSD